MKLSRTILCIMLLVLTLGAVSVHAEGLEAERTRSTGSPYYIMVNRQMNTLTVYTLGKNGTYSVPDRAMICSTGRQGHATPLGTFTLSSYKSLWTHMLDGSYGQYVSQFKGDYLIHSVCYSEKDPSTLMTDEYNMLGSVASLGCIRLQTGDAKWVFDNCPAGTRVTIYDSADPGPLGKPDRLVSVITADMDNGWDPTDPRSENPWHERLDQIRGLSAPRLMVEAVEQASFAMGNPPDAANQNTEYEPVAAAADTVSDAVSGLDSLSSEGLPFADVQPDQWYYTDVRYAYENKLLGGETEQLFSPDTPVTAETALQSLYRLSGESSAVFGQNARNSVLTWAGKLGMKDILPESVSALEQEISRQEFALLLYRFEAAYGAGAVEAPDCLHEYADGEQVLPAAEDAVCWAVQGGLLRGSAGQRLLPAELLTRAQLAAILHRYDTLSSAAFVA